MSLKQGEWRNCKFTYVHEKEIKTKLNTNDI